MTRAGRKKEVFSTKGQITVRLTAILELNISMARTGAEHIIQRFLPSKDKDAEAVEVIVINTARTNGSICRSIWLRPIMLLCCSNASGLINRSSRAATSNNSYFAY